MPLAVVIIGRDVALALGAFYLRFRTLPPPVRPPLPSLPPTSPSFPLSSPSLPTPLSVCVLDTKPDGGFLTVLFSQRTFSRYWDISRPSISIHPTSFSKFNTFLQLVLMVLLTVSPLMPDSAGPWLEGGMWVVGGTTVGSGLSYLWVKGAIRRVGLKG